MQQLSQYRQEKNRAKIFKMLVDMGFTYDIAEGFYWLPVNKDYRVCVGFEVKDKLCQKKLNCWMWQNSKLGESPMFGYSGSTSLGADFGTIERVMEITFNHFYSHGISIQYEHAKAKVTKAKSEIQRAIDNISF